MVSGATLTIDERPYQAGDRITTLRNDRRLGVRNGTCAVVTAVDPAQREMTVRTDAGIALALPARYLDAGHVRHAYATTIHKAQGQTADRAFVLGADTLYQEAGYVALSRGRTENRIYVVGAEPRFEAHAPEAQPPGPVEALTHALKSSHAQQLAVDSAIDRDAIRRELASLIHEQGRLQTITRRCPESRSYDIEALTTTRQQNVENAGRLQRELDALNEEHGWRHRDERRGRRVVLTTYIGSQTSAIDELDRAIARAHKAQTQRHEYLEKHHDEMQLLPRVEYAIKLRFGQLVNADVTDPPAYLRELGAPPKDPAHLEKWTRAAEFVEHHRVEHGITDQHHPLGTEGAADSGRCADIRRFQALAKTVHNPTREIDNGVEIS